MFIRIDCLEWLWMDRNSLGFIFEVFSLKSYRKWVIFEYKLINSLNVLNKILVGYCRMFGLWGVILGELMRIFKLGWKV